MPHGSLTPLGRRLRSVLAALRPVKHDLEANSPITARNPQCPPRYTTDALRAFVANPRPRTRAPVFAQTIASRAQHTATKPLQQSQPPAENDKTQSHISRRRLNRRTKTDHLGSELRRQLGDLVAPRIVKDKRSNHFNFRSRYRTRIHSRNAKRHAADYVPPLEKEKTPSLQRILASYIRLASSNSGQLQPGSVTSFDFAPADREYLVSKGYDVTDFKAWVSILTEPDSFVAAKALQTHALARGPRSVPLPVYSFILRRPYVSARALCILIAHAWQLCEELRSISADAVFVIFIRLVRHARKVWPAALTSIAEHLLHFLPKLPASSTRDVSASAQHVSQILNKAMYLISEPTAVAPYKDIPYQEAAVVRILTALDTHEVPLQINREGYRAVIRLQLASGKTPSEERWAGLKALSWPPWKEDQTQMDTELGPEDGISKAGHTLRRMQEAGYKPGAWEHAARIYTGWDVDGTPTIQRRTTSRPVRPGQSSDAAIWVARIKTTRTVQEAWACYLAYEDTHKHYHQDVLLAIIESLNQDDKRRYRETIKSKKHLKSMPWRIRRLFPGDTREIEPLPPSTHLHTYTRVAPPTARQFFHQLRERNIHIGKRCLAFLISNSVSVRTCAQYLIYARAQYPPVGGLLDSHSSFDLDGVPDILFEAYIKFLTRHSDSVMPKKIRRSLSSPALSVPSRRLADENYNFQHCLIQATWLLKDQKSIHMPMWNAVLQALSVSKNFSRLHLIQSAHERFLKTAERPDVNFNALLAYRLTQEVLKLMSSLHLDLDPYGFIALCHATENVGMASWKALTNDAKTLASTTRQPPPKPVVLLESKDLLNNHKPHWRVANYFQRLVGGSYQFPTRSSSEPSPPTHVTAPELPRLLTAPSPAILHAYIRALGSCGAHDHIHETIKWMVEYRDELAESASRDRNSPNMMRRTMTAVRVFLERSWLDAIDDKPVDDEATEDEDSQVSDGESQPATPKLTGKSVALQRLENPAPQSVIDEVRGLVESVEEWGGWPSDEEVDEYLEAGRRWVRGVTG